ncbi:MAG: endonuclease domain-containing protein [Clostridia bacterium]|nr:endonuclease domain-containing protein [Clostridia bacterium]
MSIDYNRKLIPIAKNLRKRMTPEEKKLWYDFLRNYPIRFQRQKTIDNYIVDFYCHQAKLIIEIDGIQHLTDEQLLKDNKRTNILKLYNLQILRFSNTDINYDFDTVCEEIDIFVRHRLQMFEEE